MTDNISLAMGPEHVSDEHFYVRDGQVYTAGYLIL